MTFSLLLTCCILLFLNPNLLSSQGQDLSKVPIIQPDTPGITLPPGTPPGMSFCSCSILLYNEYEYSHPTGAYDSLAYSTLVRYTQCPGVTKDCQYPATPNSGYVQWSCKDGYKLFIIS